VRTHVIDVDEHAERIVESSDDVIKSSEVVASGDGAGSSLQR
jgi:hypothetical protein